MLKLRKNGSLDRRYKVSKRLGKTLIIGGAIRKGFNVDRLIKWAFIILFIATAIAYWYHNSTYTIQGKGLGSDFSQFPQGFEFIEVAQARELTVEEMMCNPKFKWDCKKMIAICKAESGWTKERGWNMKAINHNTNGTWDYGFCQINQIHGYTQEELINVETYLNAIYGVWVKQGYDAWVMHWNGGYERYL